MQESIDRLTLPKAGKPTAVHWLGPDLWPGHAGRTAL